MEFDINNALTYPRRQVHLDFHTQPDLKNVGAHFRKEQFQSALRREMSPASPSLPDAITACAITRQTSAFAIRACPST